MHTSMELYFAYGSNMSRRRLASRIAGTRSLGRARVDGWRLRFDKPGRDGTGKANLVEEPAAHAWGVIYELPATEWAVLDRFEPGYRRQALRVAIDARSVEAQAYLFTTRIGAPPSAPNPEYLAHLLEGAREHELPVAHVERIRTFLAPR
jgi:gamma-glutamylcyclotransferase (GGCT)/AIG2-like uncharacterized protein YtfP